jgi:uncharacterized membrane protein
MTDVIPENEGLVRLTHLIYALHAFSAAMGLVSSAFVVTAFLTGWPSILAVILNYAKRADVGGTFLYSHFEWQIQTFWRALVLFCIGMFLILTIVLFPIGFAVLIGTGIWVLYRIVKGWMALNEGKAVTA